MAAELGDPEGLLADTRRALERMRSTSRSPVTGEEGLRGVGTANAGRIRVVAVSGGVVESVELDPRALRLPSAELGGHLVTAVNAALADLREQATTTDEASDSTRLGQELEQLHDEAARSMRMFSQGVAEAVARINSAAERQRGG